MISLKGNTEGVVQLGWRHKVSETSKKKEQQKIVRAKSHSCYGVQVHTLFCNSTYFSVVKQSSEQLSRLISGSQALPNLLQKSSKCLGLLSSWNFISPSSLHTTSVLSFASQGRVHETSENLWGCAVERAGGDTDCTFFRDVPFSCNLNKITMNGAHKVSIVCIDKWDTKRLNHLLDVFSEVRFLIISRVKI